MTEPKALVAGGGWRALHAQTLIANPWFSVEAYDVTTPDGGHRDYFSVHFSRPAVAVVATTAKKLLLIRQYRFIVDEYVWAIPSGGVGEQENLVDAAARELLEEGGCVASSLQPLIAFYASYGSSNQRFEVFLAEDPETLDLPIDANEVLERRWFDHDDVKGMLARNEIVDSLSLAPLLHYYFFRSPSSEGSGEVRLPNP